MIMNNVEITSLANLRENFNIIDLMCNFYTGILEKWLLEHKFTEKAHQVSQFKNDTSMLISKLCKILEINPDLTEQEIQQFKI